MAARKRREVSWILAVGVIAGVLGGLLGVTAQAPGAYHLVRLRESADLGAARGRRAAVEARLRETAARTQAPLLARLEEWRRRGEVRDYEPLWIINAIRVRASDRVIEALRRDPAVASVTAARPVRLPPARRTRAPGAGSREAQTSWGLERIGAPAVWARTPAVRGAGVTVAVIDTGITPVHRQFQQTGKIRAWKDFIARKSTPYDDGTWAHGTHVAGTIAGSNADGWTVGIAPEATLLVAKALDAQSGGVTDTAVAALQWAMDPDGNPNTADGADIVSCSLGGYHAEDHWDQGLRDAIEALRDANILPVFAIGNSGPDPRTTVLPGDYPTAVGVGATNSGDTVWFRSSRGPVVWDGVTHTKPDVTAPGVEILSCTPTWVESSGYILSSGTSNACPHVTGAAALAISAARARGFSPTVAALESALKSTAADLGLTGPDNTYGAGRIDAARLVDAILGSGVTVGKPVLLSPAEGAVVRPMASLQVKTPIAGGAVVRYRVTIAAPEGGPVVLDQTTATGATAFDRQSTPYGSDEVATVTVTALPAGRFEWRAAASADGGGTWTESDAGSFTVNQAPAVPEWISPADTSIVSTTPALRVRVSDADSGDTLKVKLLLTGVGLADRTVDQTASGAGWSAEAGYASGDAAGYTFAAENPLPAGRYACYAYAHDGIGWSPASRVRSLTVSADVPRSLPARLETFALSLNLPGATRQALGLAGVPMKVYDSEAAAYRDAPDALEHGRGYWLRPGTAAPVALAGPAVSAAFAIDLKPGWNFIGSPFATPVPWRLSALLVQKAGHPATPLSQVPDAMEGFAFAFRPDPVNPDTGSYALVYDSTLLPGVAADRLDPWHGYWVRAQVECRLILPDPDAVTAQSAPRAGTAGWCVPLSVRSAAGVRTLVLGAGARTLAAGLPPEAPASGRLSAALLRQGRSLAADVRAGGEGRHEWEMVVDAGEAPDAGDVVLTCDLKALPRSISLVLLDGATGERRSLRMSGSYRFRPTGGPRRFRILARPAGTAQAAVTDVRLVGTRSGSRVLQFTLTRAAVVDADLLSPTGRVVATAARGQASEAGVNVATVPGRLARGLYLVRVRATTEEGSTAQSVRPVVVVE